MRGVRDQGPFPELALPDLEGRPRPLSETWRDGPALFLIGHQSCRTTREMLPFLDRIHRRRPPTTSVVAILQDDAPTARELARQAALEVPIRLEADPYPLAAALELIIVPTLFLLDEGGEIQRAAEGFSRADLEALAQRLGVGGPLFTEADAVPELRPG